MKSRSRSRRWRERERESSRSRRWREERREEDLLGGGFFGGVEEHVLFKLEFEEFETLVAETLDGSVGNDRHQTIKIPHKLFQGKDLVEGFLLLKRCFQDQKRFKSVSDQIEIVSFRCFRPSFDS